MALGKRLPAMRERSRQYARLALEALLRGEVEVLDDVAAWGGKAVKTEPAANASKSSVAAVIPSAIVSSEHVEATELAQRALARCAARAKIQILHQV